MADLAHDVKNNVVTFQVEPEEAIEIRKTALLAAAQVYQHTNIDYSRDILRLAEKFEQHILRGIPLND